MDHWGAGNPLSASCACPGLQKELELEYDHHGSSRHAPYNYGSSFTQIMLQMLLLSICQLVHLTQGTIRALQYLHVASTSAQGRCETAWRQLSDPEHPFMQLRRSIMRSASTATCTGTGPPLRGSPTLMSRASSLAP